MAYSEELRRRVPAVPVPWEREAVPARVAHSSGIAAATEPGKEPAAAAGDGVGVLRRHFVPLLEDRSCAGCGEQWESHTQRSPAPGLHMCFGDAAVAEEEEAVVAPAAAAAAVAPAEVAHDTFAAAGVSMVCSSGPAAGVMCCWWVQEVVGRTGFVV